MGKRGRPPKTTSKSCDVSGITDDTVFQLPDNIRLSVDYQMSREQFIKSMKACNEAHFTPVSKLTDKDREILQAMYINRYTKPTRQDIKWYDSQGEH